MSRRKEKPGELVARGQTTFDRELGFPAIPAVEPKAKPTALSIPELPLAEPRRRYVRFSLPPQTQILVRHMEFGQITPDDSTWFTQNIAEVEVLEEDEAKRAGVIRIPPGYIPVRFFTAETVYANGEHLVIMPSEIVFIPKEVAGSRIEKPDDLSLFEFFEIGKEIVFWYNLVIEKGVENLSPVRALFQFKAKRIGDISGGYADFELLEPCIGIRFNYERQLNLHFRDQIKPQMASLRKDIARGGTYDDKLIQLQTEADKIGSNSPMMFEVHNYPSGKRISLPVRRELTVMPRKIM